MIASPKFLATGGAGLAGPVGPATDAERRAAGRTAGGVGGADEVSVLGAGELGRSEVLDRLVRRGLNDERFPFRFDDETRSPQRGQLLGAAGDQGLRSQDPGDLAVEGVPLGPIFDGGAGGTLGVEGLLRIFPLLAESVLKLPLLSELRHPFGAGGILAAALFGFHLRQSNLDCREGLELLERDRHGRRLGRGRGAGGVRLGRRRRDDGGGGGCGSGRRGSGFGGHTFYLGDAG